MDWPVALATSDWPGRFLLTENRVGDISEHQSDRAETLVVPTERCRGTSRAWRLTTGGGTTTGQLTGREHLFDESA